MISESAHLANTDELDRLGRMVSLGALGGLITGLLVGGIANRLVMRILALVNGDRAGLVTENGNVAGEITAGGTAGLIIFVGVVSGVIGGLIYVTIRRWLPDLWPIKGLTFGLVLLCIFGRILVFDSDNIDFALFALLFVMFGVVASLATDRLDRHVPALFYSRPITWIGYLALGGAGGFGLYRLVPAISWIL